MRRSVFFAFLFLAFSAACVKDKPNPDRNWFTMASPKGIVVLNEGSYGNNNGEISFIDPAQHTVANDVFSTVNQKSLGDVAQSIALINGRYYIAINNAHKIVVLDTSSFNLLQTISDVSFPRYIIQVSADFAYVSSLYKPHVYVLKLSSGTVTDTLFTDFPNTEKMLVQQHDVWICNWDTACNYLYRADGSTHEIKEKITLPCVAPFDIVADKYQRLWILCGNTWQQKSATLLCYNPSSKQIEKKLSFLVADDPIRLTLNSGKDSLYFINVNYNGQAHNGVYRMDIDDQSLPVSPWISAPANSYFWALGISDDGHIYIADPKGFTQRSSVYEYTVDGKLLHQYQTGTGSNQFLFR